MMRRFERKEVLAAMDRPRERFTYVYGALLEPEKEQEAKSDLRYKSGERESGLPMRKEEREALERQSGINKRSRRRKFTIESKVRRSEERLQDRVFKWSDVQAVRTTEHIRRSRTGGMTIEDINRRVETQFKRRRKKK
jgi:hypothetical protein